MIKLGEYQELIVVKKVEFGVYLAQKPEDETRVLLPAKQVPQEVKIGDVLKVFLYKDSKITTGTTGSLRSVRNRKDRSLFRLGLRKRSVLTV